MIDRYSLQRVKLEPYKCYVDAHAWLCRDSRRRFCVNTTQGKIR